MNSIDVHALAVEAQLDLVGLVKVGPTPSWEAYRDWVAKGYAGEMRYLSRPEAIERRADPRHIMPEARSILVVGATYAGPPQPDLPTMHGGVSRYAWGEDYHRWLLRRLKKLVRDIANITGPFPYRCYVDTGPVLERAWAQAAGLGWIGKNGCLIHPTLGSYLFLGVALLGIALPPTPPPALPSCGTCTRCMESCPTGAIVAPGVIDARRCLAYLTIENRGPIPEAYRSTLGNRVFGCDVCQEVCPWNQKPLQTHQHDPPHPNVTLFLPEILRMPPEAFRARFRKTAIWRATPDGLARNAVIVLGNQRRTQGDSAIEEVLSQAVTQHPSALVQEHASWALESLR